MCLRPLLARIVKLKRPIKRGRMTIAMGERFEHKGKVCALACADSRVTATDGATIFGAKTHLTVSAQRAFAIADSSEDGHAAKMLASEITTALCDEKVATMKDVVDTIKHTMTDWHSAYGAVKPPGIQYVLAAGLRGNCELFYCSPPNTVLPKRSAFSIGSGGRAIDPLTVSLESSTDTPVQAEAAILRAAYWMYRAKRDEGAFVGGDAHLYMVSQWGMIAMLGSDEMQKGEELGKKIDDLLIECRYKLLSHSPDGDQREYLALFGAAYLKLAADARSIAMPTLSWLEPTKWTKKKTTE